MVTIFLTTDEIKAKFIAFLATQTTAKFIAVKGYTNNIGEVSDYVVNVGIDYGKAKAEYTERLKVKENLKDVEFGNLVSLSEEARIALLNASLKPSTQSKAQSDAYTQLCPNIRMHNETGRVYVNGYKISKTVIEEVDYPEVNSAPLTIAKNIIRKALKAPKYRQFCFDKLVDIRMNGETLEFDC